MEYLSIYLHLFQFIPLLSYGFQYTGLSYPWLNLFLRYFILFDAFVNEIVFLIFLSGGNATNLYTLILYPATLLNLFILTVFWWSL